MKEIVFDTETTGLSPENGDRVIEIAAVEIDDFRLTQRSFHAYINPEREIPAGAIDVHGITNDFIADKPLFAAVVDDFLAFIGDAPLVAHNAEFDFRFLNAELKRLGRPPLDPARMVDTLAIARSRHPGAANSLDALCKRYGIDLSRRTKHGALIDSEILAELYIELKCKRQSSLSLQVVSAAKQRVQRAAPIAVRKEDIRLVTSDEIERHQSYFDKAWAEGGWAKYL
ncbi:DNA polymerase III subunit epsilon [Rhodoblastus sphagnicola]|uniref:DNA polymerase III subunit epsilon n=1 Tax=Rhodoblastus sphagnicola TaxID=333368 RepID=A0A2S6N912_9HYPH|nr:DNA polymerase III subunit epsilon [Rhodoblastus sphagnicola]MBB4196880.1 DNA polymerase-3 subunit epsilon [Rhodoblastus sphagnicola]PPQ31102.1 DNA polymerase III subunit epsilon [Rhodoblastus sphagnicola]